MRDAAKVARATMFTQQLIHVSRQTSGCRVILRVSACALAKFSVLPQSYEQPSYKRIIMCSELCSLACTSRNKFKFLDVRTFSSFLSALRHASWKKEGEVIATTVRVESRMI